jgi:hypothetical protein
LASQSRAALSDGQREQGGDAGHRPKRAIERVDQARGGRRSHQPGQSGEAGERDQPSEGTGLAASSHIRMTLPITTPIVVK